MSWAQLASRFNRFGALIGNSCVPARCLTLSSKSYALEKIRNVAIVAHVDHGKTSLVDKLLKQSGMACDEERLLDSGDLEKERGITIVSKCTRIERDGFCFNVVDTPGHRDFGGEVERILSMVEGVVLVVDASEGPMPQTKFVLKKALEAKLRPVVVINKADRKDTRRIGEVDSEVFDLFVNLDADEDQLEYPLLYCSAKEGWAVHDLEKEEALPEKNLDPLFEAIKSSISPPAADRSAPFAMSITSMEKDAFLGKIVTGKIVAGSICEGSPVKALTFEGDSTTTGTITKILVTCGLTKTSITEGLAGDIVSIAGIEASVSETVCSPERDSPVRTVPIDPPTIAMTFGVSDSPLAGKEGTSVTSNLIKERLEKETENNVTIQLKPALDNDSIEVHGRGELQMGILIEQMRREGFEMCVSPPRVLYKIEEGTGKKLEPWEEITIEVDSGMQSTVMDKMSRRGGEIVEFVERAERCRMIFKCASRRLMGYRSEFNLDTKGSGLFFSVFDSYRPFAAATAKLRKGVLVSSAQGEATGHALMAIEARGTLFIKPGDKVFEGMIIGEHSRETDLDVNPVREKKLSNVRTAGTDEKVRLSPPRKIPIEDCLMYMQNDEKLEISPTTYRLRKDTLNQDERRRIARNAKTVESTGRKSVDSGT